MVVVSHEMQFAREVASRALFMDRGLVAEEDPARQALTNPKSDRLHTFLSRLSFVVN